MSYLAYSRSVDAAPVSLTRVAAAAPCRDSAHAHGLDGQDDEDEAGGSDASAAEDDASTAEEADEPAETDESGTETAADPAAPSEQWYSLELGREQEVAEGCDAVDTRYANLALLVN